MALLWVNQSVANTLLLSYKPLIQTMFGLPGSENSILFGHNAAINVCVFSHVLISHQICSYKC